MSTIKNIEDIKALIDGGVEESTTLEYKRNFAKQNPHWKEELAKDVSAMANSNGGTIIYGIKEKENKKGSPEGSSIPIDICPIPATEMKKDQLTQLLATIIQPKIEDIEILYLNMGEEGGIFVLNIPQSYTAHQDKLNYLYYKRRNAVVDKMEDYEIRDVMNRSKTPIVKLSFELHKKTIEIIHKGSLMGIKRLPEKKSISDSYTLNVSLINEGQILAHYINFFLYLPKEIINEEDQYKMTEEGMGVFFGDNTVHDLTGFNGGQRLYGPYRYNPLLPGIENYNMSIKLTFDKIDFDQVKKIDLKYVIHADNAPAKTYNIRLDDIFCIEDSKETRIDDPFTNNLPYI